MKDASGFGDGRGTDSHLASERWREEAQESPRLLQTKSTEELLPGRGARLEVSG